MIAFTCPRCENLLEHPDTEAGLKVRCPACNQKVRIPQPPPPPNQTLLGELQFPAESRAVTVTGELFSEPQMLVSPQTKNQGTKGKDARSVSADPRIRFVCPSCGRSLKAPAGAVGKKGKCKRCGARMVIPAPAPEPEVIMEAAQPPVEMPLPGATPPQLQSDG